MKRPGRGKDNGRDPDEGLSPIERLKKLLDTVSLPDSVRERMVETIRRLGPINPRDIDIRDLIFGDKDGDLKPDDKRPGGGLITDDFRAKPLEIDDLSDLIAIQIRNPPAGKDRLFAVADGVLNEIRKNTPDLLPDRPLLTGKIGASLPLAPDAVTQLMRLATVRDRKPDGDDTSVVWDDGASQILVHIGRITTRIGDGSVQVSIPVETDVGKAEMVVPFAVGSETRVTGLIAAAPDRPAGDAAIADVWGEALIALAYKALLDVADSLAGASGRDNLNDRLVPQGLTARKDALVVGTQARFRYKGAVP